MTETVSEEKATTKSEQWRERLTAQERSGLSVKEFCKERGITACTFYAWRNRLREEGAVRFALVDRGRVGQEPAAEASLELVLATGERLRIGAGVDAGTLRTVLDALRA
jgi:transposase-like protein